ncbi:MAG TPA: hypothetical protein IAC74_00105 [Candidatus Aphodoplasma excrementigallinarum]|uniref:Metallothionein n=1 Tax=Candidatus Aphodoplasma excrementigallinarum TaxID=2840673 RepID=A0A9D1SYQ7_9FIRM|nr:hypothetical protein [Candidatus Aphodoplasma excrementigallinarum]
MYCCNNDNWFGASANGASACGLTASIGEVPMQVYTGSGARSGCACTNGHSGCCGCGCCGCGCCNCNCCR